MSIPGMDLQAQYEQTLQNTIGKSQRDRLQDVRKQQTLANTDWSQRGVGQGAQRMAGFQEVNPSSMPNMSDETRSFIKPLLGTYQEGGRDVEGFYGKENPYTQGGLESILTGQGYARAPSSLEEQFKYAGLKLPNAYGQNYYNAQHEAVGNEISKYQQQEQLQNQGQNLSGLINDLRSKISPDLAPRLINGDQIDYYVQRGFVPGQDNGENWKWREGAPQYAQLLGGSSKYDPSSDPNYQEQLNLYNMGWRQERPEIPKLSEEQQWANDANDYFTKMYPKGSGSWDYYKDGKYVDMRGLEYSPITGFNMPKDEGLKGSPQKWMPALTMAALSMMAPAAGAIATTAQSGLNGGDWKQAIGKGLMSYAGGELAGTYGGDLAGAFGGTSDLAKGIAGGVIRTGVNTLGNAALGNGFDWRGGLANLAAGAAGGYLGGLAGDAVGGDLGKVVGGATRGLTTGALSSYLKGDTPGINTAIDTFAGAAGGLKGLFSNTNEDKQSVNGPTKLADTIQGMKNAPTKNWRT